MKQKVLDQCLSKEMKCKDGARLLQMHAKAFSRLKKNYQEKGVIVLTPAKPGPKPGHPPPNKTPKDIEEMVIALAEDHRNYGPIALSDELFDEFQIKLDAVTVWRILKRNKRRYFQSYEKIERSEPILYCLDEPGMEIQLDGSYPFGRGRRIICFDAVDDCSRWAYSKLYIGTEDTAKAIDFVAELIAVAPFIIRKIRIDNKLSKDFDVYCQSRGIEVVRNNPYEPKQNGKVERYHKTLKHKLFWVHFGYLDDIEKLNYKLKLWLGYYNGCKRHGGYGMKRMTPTGKISSVLTQKFLNSYLMPCYPQKVTLSLQQYNH